ncbi:MAG: transcriptional regulator, partial [Acetobacteraceae bacterium]
LRESGLIQTECAGTTHMNKLRRAELEARFPGLMAAILEQRASVEGS